MKRIVVAIVVVLIGIGLLEGGRLVHAGQWLFRACRADWSSVWVGKTNGHANKEIIQLAQTYIRNASRIDRSDGSISLSDPRLVHFLDRAWFRHHAPAWVAYSPPGLYKEFNTGQWAGDSKAMTDRYVVFWMYVLGCQKASGPNVPTVDWYDIQGNPCNNTWAVLVVMTPDLKLDKLLVVSVDRV